MTPVSELSITICSWNTLADLRLCLASLEPERDDFLDLEVIVVDNNSEDGSPDMVAMEFPRVRLLRQSVNLGFTGGHNHALSLRSHPTALLLNSDTIVHRGALLTLAKAAAARPGAGVLGPRLLNPDGSLQKSCRRFPNPIAAAFRNTPLGKLFPNNRFVREYLMDDYDHSLPRSVDWVSGAAMWVTGPALDILKGFDPEFFMYCEDVDLCWRARKAGYDVVYIPESVIVHAIGRSTDQVPNRMIGRFHRSMLRFFLKNMVPERPLLLRPFSIAGAALAIGIRASIFIVKNKIDRLRFR